MKLYQLCLLCGLTLTTAACSNWIYRIDVPQGNFLDQQAVDKLRIGMTKEQVIYVLGHPVVNDAFDKDTWYYVYDMKRGMKNRGEDFQKQMIITFENERLAKIDGDFELSEDFNTPLDQ
ncbi:outer membrane protein assembly factor BamE [Alteromonas aestuariivivens]|uniref:Outer membrane protein assembly factor BamE n=1 Tax=Alteromonas aestuariivivens TaxID=1938339 RepID=A0A3D8M4W0_9ALTE|nr:outer membrane protein assembly factor BamE [Alteromonas aestuariivivens]RDV24610.1 outer membrane protein assembly factor BamE [Alteromonas aestuariivivens]